MTALKEVVEREEFFDECPECGADGIVTTTSTKVGWYWDGDPVRCSECDCKGSVAVDDRDEENPRAYVSWDW